MSLISQNILHKNRVNKTTREDLDVPSPLEGIEHVEDVQGLVQILLGLRSGRKNGKKKKKSNWKLMTKEY